MCEETNCREMATQPQHLCEAFVSINPEASAVKSKRSRQVAPAGSSMLGIMASIAILVGTYLLNGTSRLSFNWR